MVRTGQVWQIGKHRVLCGDSTDSLLTSVLYDVDTVDCIWTDPPYGIKKMGGAGARSSTRKEQGIRWIANDELLGDGLVSLWVRAMGVIPLKVGGSAFWCASWRRQAEVLALIARLNPKQSYSGLAMQSVIVWNKNRMGLCDTKHGRFRAKHEWIYWFTKGRYEWHGDLCQSNSWTVPGWSGARPASHPTPKPRELIRRSLSQVTLPGMVVADPFAGSGQTLFVCIEMGRVGRVSEIDATYCEYILREAERMTGERAQCVYDANAVNPNVPDARLPVMEESHAGLFSVESVACTPAAVGA